MIWAIAIAGGTGVLIGVWLQVPAVLFASAVAVLAGIVHTSLTSWPLFEAVVYCVALLVTLQAGFLLGGALACGRSR
jgi:hypothetical protein